MKNKIKRSPQIHGCMGLVLSLALGCSSSVSGPPEGMVLVPGSIVTLGADDWETNINFENAKLIPDVKVTSFFLDQTEVTAEAYQTCVKYGQCKLPAHGTKDYEFCNYDLGDPKNPQDSPHVVSGKEKHPMNCVTFTEAKAYCEALGKRLPTEIEWEYTARGNVKSLYPWGDTLPSMLTFKDCWDNKTGTCKVGTSAYPTFLGNIGKTGDVGVDDLAGNVSEWVDTLYSFTPSAKNTPCPGDPTSFCSIRGGSWSHGEAVYLRASYRQGNLKTYFFPDVGFRCAKSVE